MIRQATKGLNHLEMLEGLYRHLELDTPDSAEVYQAIVDMSTPDFVLNNLLYEVWFAPLVTEDEKFTYYINDLDTHLDYDGEEIYELSDYMDIVERNSRDNIVE